MDNDTKRCPFCGEEIKAKAIKCKHCGEFLETPETEQTKEINIPKPSGCVVGCVWVIGIFLILGIIGSFIPDDTTDVSEESKNIEQVLNDNNQDTYNSTPQKVTGDYSGFSSWASMNANYGGQLANCQQRGAGISLVEQIENLFEFHVSPTNRQQFYAIKEHNPDLRFKVTNPVWAESVYYPNICKADVEFKNIKADTVMGYNNGTPFTVENSYCYITYTVSEQGGKHKANAINIFCNPSSGYN